MKLQNFHTHLALAERPLLPVLGSSLPISLSTDPVSESAWLFARRPLPCLVVAGGDEASLGEVPGDAALDTGRSGEEEVGDTAAASRCVGRDSVDFTVVALGAGM